MVIVFGSINLDIVTHVPHLPAAGETVKGRACQLIPGGKGANQALAVARAGSQSIMAGAVGRDMFAPLALAGLQAEGLPLEHIAETPEPTGIATIAVDKKGENSIVVASGANLMARAAQLSRISQPQGFLLTQNEVLAEEVLAAHRWAKAQGLTTVHNAAPAHRIRAQALQHIDWLIVNELEAVHTAKAAGLAGDAPQAIGQALAAYGGNNVIITLGAEGACSFGKAGAHHVPALPVEVEDTTASGDTFAGVFAASLEQGFSVQKALQRAAVAASLACTISGAQTSIPSKTSIDAQLEILQNKA